MNGEKQYFSFPNVGHHNRHNVKKTETKLTRYCESTPLYLAVVLITSNMLLDLSRFTRTKADTDLEKPLFRTFQAGISKPAHVPDRREKNQQQNN